MTDEKDQLRYQETLLCKPYKFNARTKKHGHVWKIIANDLDERVARERFTLIAKKKKKTKEQERLVGLHPLNCLSMNKHWRKLCLA